MANFKEDLAKIKAFVFDVDGVLAKTSFYLHPNGEFMRSMNTQDGFSIKHAVKQGFPVAIITGGKSQSVKDRFNGLGVTDVYLGSHDKIEDFEDFIYKYGISPEDILYMGDDIPDMEVMLKVGIPTCPVDAVSDIKKISRYVSEYKGGEGCVRDVVEQTLRSQNKWYVSEEDATKSNE